MCYDTLPLCWDNLIKLIKVDLIKTVTSFRIYFLMG